MTIDWTKEFVKYKGLWVALEDNQQNVIFAGKTVREAIKGAKEKGFDDPIVMRFPTEIISYVG